MSKPREWFRFQNAASDPSIAEIQIIDFIGGWYDDFANRYWGEDITVTARAFVEQLSKLPDSVKALHVHINSPGGDVQGGINIANALREQASKGRTVETFIDGIAASIASVIAMAGSKVHIADNALVMIHNPWGFTVGNAAEMRKYADVLDTIRTQAVATYRWHSSLEPEAIEKLMDDETWMDADEAIANGFATDKVEGLKAAAALPRQALASLKVPARFRARVNALARNVKEDDEPEAAAEPDENGECPEGYELGEDGVCRLVTSAADDDDDDEPAAEVEPDGNGECPEGYELGEDGVCRLASGDDKAKAAATAEQLLPLCQKAGVSMQFLAILLQQKVSLPQARRRIKAMQVKQKAAAARESRDRAAAAVRAEQIAAACRVAGVPELSASLTAGGMTMQQVKAHLAALRPRLDGGEVDGTLSADEGRRSPVALNAKDIYAARAAKKH